MTEQAAESVEQVLRDELVRGDAVIASARPILRHLPWRTSFEQAK